MEVKMENLDVVMDVSTLKVLKCEIFAINENPLNKFKMAVV